MNLARINHLALVGTGSPVTIKPRRSRLAMLTAVTRTIAMAATLFAFWYLSH